jgi:hypothetical protein
LVPGFDGGLFSLEWKEALWPDPEAKSEGHHVPEENKHDKGSKSRSQAAPHSSSDLGNNNIQVRREVRVSSRATLTFRDSDMRELKPATWVDF